MPTVNDFIALDVETANADFGSICAIGLVHFRANEIFNSLTILVDPEDHFDPINIAIHGIRPEDVAGKPTMAQVFPVIRASLNDTVVVHHSPFDKTALNRASIKYGTENLACSWLDTLRVARRTWPVFAKDGGYGLANLADAFSIDFVPHDAAEDARVSGLILLKAMTDSGLSLLDWIDRVELPVNGHTNSKHSQQGNPNGPLAGEVIVFTGSLRLSRSDAAAIAANAGCEVCDSITKRTTILVVGQQDLRLTRGQSKSSKHRKCEEMIRAGAPIRILGEHDFMLMVQ